jgi:hypothetical protein
MIESDMRFLSWQHTIIFDNNFELSPCTRHTQSTRVLCVYCADDFDNIFYLLTARYNHIK